MPDPDMEDYGDEEGVAYNVVANPRLEFAGNAFHVFTEELLNFPGANNVPLGALSLKGNKVGIYNICLPGFLIVFSSCLFLFLFLSISPSFIHFWSLSFFSFSLFVFLQVEYTRKMSCR